MVGGSNKSHVATNAKGLADVNHCKMGDCEGKPIGVSNWSKHYNAVHKGDEKKFERCKDRSTCNICEYCKY